EERAQGGCEVQTDLLLHLHLIDGGQVELDGVFRRHDVRLQRVQGLQRGVERVRFTRTRGACDENHAVGLRDVALELNERLRLEAKPRHVEHQTLLVEQAEHYLLAEQSRQRRDAEVQLARATVRAELDLDATVLRQTLLGDVELRHDLDARDERVAESHRRVHYVVGEAVNAEGDRDLLLV